MAFWGYVLPSRAAITEYHRVGGINRDYFLTILEAEKSKVKVPSGLVSDKVSAPGLPTATFSLYPSRAICLCTRQEKDFWSFPLRRTSVLLDWGLPLMTLITSSKALYLNKVTYRVRASAYKWHWGGWGAGQNLSHNRLWLLNKIICHNSWGSKKSYPCESLEYSTDLPHLQCVTAHLSSFSWPIFSNLSKMVMLFLADSPWTQEPKAPC